MKSPAWAGDWPISQWFGVNPAAYVRFGLQGHNGIDLAMPEEIPIYAPCRGTVAEVAYDAAGYGNYVKLSTADGQDWLFAHLRRTFVSVGYELPEGLVLLGESGTTGNSTGPHLHVGWRLWNAAYNRGWPFNGYVDPRQTLDRLQGGLWPPS